jgi:hypothetical protein
MLALTEITEQLRVHHHTIKRWHAAGMLTAHRANDLNEQLSDQPVHDPRLVRQPARRIATREGNRTDPRGALLGSRPDGLNILTVIRISDRPDRRQHARGAAARAALAARRRTLERFYQRSRWIASRAGRRTTGPSLPCGQPIGMIA